MKFEKTQKIPLRTPIAKTAEYFIQPPKHAGKFALLKTKYITRDKIFNTGDLVRISMNQRYIDSDRSIQVVSIAETVSNVRRFMGNQYVIPKSHLEYITEIPEGTQIRLVSKEYSIPALSKLTVLSHSKRIITVNYGGQKLKIHDDHIEGIPSSEHSEEKYYYDNPEEVPRPSSIRDTAPGYRWHTDTVTYWAEEEPREREMPL